MGPSPNDRAEEQFSPDPFPEISPALLNSADIYRYAQATKMVSPFEEDFLKPSSYVIRIGEKVIYWDDNGKLNEKTLRGGERFVVPRNSIVFIKTFEKLTLPSYIAMRFNLNIKNVHKGILLGTGPLVDPGFEGHLLIPLHNLTNNDYYFRQGDKFIWAEFTKISPNSLWDRTLNSTSPERSGDAKYREFDKNKKNLSEWAYLDSAFKGPIRSSIPAAIASAEKAAKEAKRFLQVISVGGLAGIVASLYTLYYWSSEIIQDIDNKIISIEQHDANQIESLRQLNATNQTELRVNQAENNARSNAIEDRVGKIEIQIQQLIDQMKQDQKVKQPR